MTEEEKPAKDAELVSIIASGYEWTCPECDKLNNVICHTEIVICSNTKCGKSFYTDDPDHAIG